METSSKCFISVGSPLYNKDSTCVLFGRSTPTDGQELSERNGLIHASCNGSALRAVSMGGVGNVHAILTAATCIFLCLIIRCEFYLHSKEAFLIAAH
jgi:hypothetical protein